jgi:hypothetical protein
MGARPSRTTTRDKTLPAALKPLLAGLCAPSRLIASARVLRDIRSRIDAGPDVHRAAVSFRPRGVPRTGDLYRAGKPVAGLVLAPGAAQLGKDDPRLVAFAQALARARFEVLIPDLPGLRNLRVNADDAGIIADALSVMSAHRAAHGSATVGIIAICYSTGPAMLALRDAHVRGAAQFMLSIGGYYDIEAAITFATTGYYRHPADPTRRYRLPDEYGKWLFAINSAAVLEERRDRELLETMAHRRLDDNGADISDLVSGLGGEGRTVHALLENRDPDRVSALIAALPDNVGHWIAELDLKQYDFSELDVRFILTHAHDDAVIPETESMALAAALPRADLFVLNSIEHVDPGPAGLADKLRMLAAMYEFLRERDTVRPPKEPVGKSPLESPAPAVTIR